MFNVTKQDELAQHTAKLSERIWVSKFQQSNQFLWILSYQNLLNPYIFISRVFSCGGALSIFTLGTMCMDGAMGTIRDSFEAIFTFALTLTHT